MSVDVDEDLFRRLWMRASLAPGYDVAEWTALEAQLTASRVEAAKVSIEGLAPIVSVQASPVQSAGLDRKVSSATYGGPATRRDCRLLLDVKALGAMLDVACESRVQRVVLNQCGIRVDVYETPGGHRYEVWHFVAADMKPERFDLLGER